MEPRIQYATTSDGVSIAYAEAGTGTPLIFVPPPGFTHAELSWQAYESILQPLASRFRAIWFDARGTGLSDRDTIDFSTEAMVRDLDAVVARTGVRSFVLAAWTNAAPAAVSYVLAQPARVTHLILCDPYVSFADFSQSAAYRAAVGLLEMDWMLYTETFGQVLWGWANPEFGRQFGGFMRACTEPDAHRAVWEANKDYDIRDLLPNLAVPTLVVQNKNNRLFPVAVGRRAAATAPDAHLALIDDIGLYATTPGLIESFVSENDDDVAPEAPSGTAVILFADIADSTALTERLGDAAFRGKARDLDSSLRTVIREHAGTPIEGKLLGDGVLAVFTSARQAIEAALACARAGDDASLPLHFGLHAGDVIREENNVYGGAVNIASRISGLSASGEVLVSETVRSLARTSAGVTFEDRGEQELKGVGEAVRVWVVREAGTR
jgi:class 3 adenylate cyclase/pimeloyl-ACP methyl ester carboxylesterase